MSKPSKYPFPWPTIVGNKIYSRMWYLHKQGKLTEGLKQRYISLAQDSKGTLVKVPYQKKVSQAVLDVWWTQITIKTDSKQALNKVVSLIIKALG